MERKGSFGLREGGVMGRMRTEMIRTEKMA
jgi:hypothetical protein